MNGAAPTAPPGPAAPDRRRAGVKAVYDAYRTELMNRKYYGARLASLGRRSNALDVLVAVGTSGAVGGWHLWQSATGQTVWQLLAGAAALLALAKPFLQLPRQIERATRLFAGHGVAFYDLKAIVEEIARLEDLTPEMLARYAAVRERTKSLSPDDDPSPSRALVRRSYNEVLREIPAGSLWWPPDGGTNG